MVRLQDHAKILVTEEIKITNIRGRACSDDSELQGQQLRCVQLGEIARFSGCVRWTNFAPTHC